MRLIHMLPACASVLGLGCADVHLVPLQQDTLLERQHIAATFCAPEPQPEDLPYKILFVIDTSLSNAWNDPAGHRERAVRGAINSLINVETVSFGIITFSDEPRRQTFGFTRDLEILHGATANISSTQGGTNYSDTLWSVIDFVNDDLGALSQFEAARTHYVVFWLSDGFPTVGVTETTALVPSVGKLLETAEGQVAEVRFNTAFLAANGETDPHEAEAASELLQELADRGHGDFTSITSGEEFVFDIERRQVTAQFKLSYAIASNRHAVFAPDLPQPDSDADGLSDRFEISRGLDPTSADSDDDGVRDDIDWRLSPSTTSASNAGCASDEDSDRDGLSDCEERILGTVPNNPDSDGDRILDSMEVIGGTSPSEDDAILDDDFDGIANHDEVRFHLDPHLPNSPEEVSAWAYRYQVTELDPECTDGCLDPPPCYALRIENLAMLETLETPHHPRGGNIFDVVVAFRGHSSMLYSRAEVRGSVLLEENKWNPPGGRFVLDPSDFRPYLRSVIVR